MASPAMEDQEAPMIPSSTKLECDPHFGQKAQGMAISFVISLISNFIFSTGVFGGKTVAQVSNQNPTFVTPDGLTFAIWGVIYSLEAVMIVVVNFNLDNRKVQELFSGYHTGRPSAAIALTTAFILNALWLPAYVLLEDFLLSFLILGLYLVVLLVAYRSLNPLNVQNTPELLAFSAGVSCNISWAVIATCVNLINVFGELGIVDPNGVAGTVWLAFVVIAGATVVATVVAVALLDAHWPAVAAWALLGIYRMQTNPQPGRFPAASQKPFLARISLLCSLALVVIAIVSYIRFTRRYASTSRQGTVPGLH